MYACFIDLKKAFDSLVRWFIPQTSKNGICGKIYQVLKSMYDGSQAKVKCNQFMSDPINITKGVHQDNVLTLFINDLGDDIIDTETHVLYDDVTVLSILSGLKTRSLGLNTLGTT